MLGLLLRLNLKNYFRFDGCAHRQACDIAHQAARVPGFSDDILQIARLYGLIGSERFRRRRELNAKLFRALLGTPLAEICFGLTFALSNSYSFNSPSSELNRCRHMGGRVQLDILLGDLLGSAGRTASHPHSPYEEDRPRTQCLSESVEARQGKRTEDRFGYDSWY